MGTKSNIAWNTLFTFGNLLYLLRMLGAVALGMFAIIFLSVGLKLLGILFVAYGAYCGWSVARQMGRDVRNIAKPGDWRVGL